MWTLLAIAAAASRLIAVGLAVWRDVPPLANKSNGNGHRPLGLSTLRQVLTKRTPLFGLDFANLGAVEPAFG
jgi:hypothetical protein